MNFSGLAVATVLAILQVTSSGPLRIGVVARQLSAQDLVEVERVATTAGGKPWLLVGREPCCPRRATAVQAIEAYLPAEKATIEFRRGSIVRVFRQSNQQPWAVTVPAPDRGGLYAQVAAPGRPLDSIIDDRDINQPFVIVGTFQDAELISIVSSIRSGNRGLQATWPIISVTRVAADSARASLRSEKEVSGVDITLSLQGGNWTITRVVAWIA